MSLLHIERKEDFITEVLNVGKPAMVDFWAPWCGPCKMLGPIVEAMAGEIDYAVIAKVDVDVVSELATEYGVQNIPTIIFFKEGKEVQRRGGVRSKNEMMVILDSLK